MTGCFLVDIMWNTAHRLYIRGWWWSHLAKMFETMSFLVGANEISAKSMIGMGTHFHHRGVGCVVHEKTVIGDDCVVFQNVTIGSRWKGGICEGGAPIIGDNVIIGAGAVILGNIRIGDNAHIGANAVVTEDVPSESTAVGVPAKLIYMK